VFDMWNFRPSGPFLIGVIAVIDLIGRLREDVDIGLQ
jgi:hypothetical protein